MPSRVQADGKILLGGTFTTLAPNGGATVTRNGIARLNPDGTLDAAFDPNANSFLLSIAVQADGKILASGAFTTLAPNGGAAVTRNHIARLATLAPTPNTQPGTNVTVQTPTGDARATFAQVTAAGTTTFTPINPPSSAGTPPTGYTIEDDAPAYDITTTATYAPPIDVCFTVSSVNDATVFSKLRLLHGENGVLVDRTFRQDFTARQIYARVSALSPFVLAMTDTPFQNAQLLNISTRMRVLTGDQVLIAGFIITGTDPKKVIIRGMGPSLNGVGVTLSDPTLELHQGNTTLATNDNWKINDQTGQSQEADIRATTIPPTNDLESAIVATLSPGAYTAILAGKNGGTGVGFSGGLRSGARRELQAGEHQHAWICGHGR